MRVSMFDDNGVELHDNDFVAYVLEPSPRVKYGRIQSIGADNLISIEEAGVIHGRYPRIYYRKLVIFKEMPSVDSGPATRPLGEL